MKISVVLHEENGAGCHAQKLEIKGVIKEWRIYEKTGNRKNYTTTVIRYAAVKDSG